MIKWFDDVITDIKVNPYDTRTVFVATLNKGVYKTNDKGGTWQLLEGLKAFPRETEEMQILVMDKKNPNVLYSGAKYGLLKTVDGGGTWEPFQLITPPTSVDIFAAAINPQNNREIYYPRT